MHCLVNLTYTYKIYWSNIKNDNKKEFFREEIRIKKE
jgi:hypothetical protein